MTFIPIQILIFWHLVVPKTLMLFLVFSLSLVWPILNNPDPDLDPDIGDCFTRVKKWYQTNPIQKSSIICAHWLIYWINVWWCISFGWSITSKLTLNWTHIVRMQDVWQEPTTNFAITSVAVAYQEFTQFPHKCW